MGTLSDHAQDDTSIAIVNDTIMTCVSHEIIAVCRDSHREGCIQRCALRATCGLLYGQHIVDRWRWDEHYGTCQSTQQRLRKIPTPHHNRDPFHSFGAGSVPVIIASRADAEAHRLTCPVERPRSRVIQGGTPGVHYRSIAVGIGCPCHRRCSHEVHLTPAFPEWPRHRVSARSVEIGLRHCALPAGRTDAGVCRWSAVPWRMADG